MLDYISVHQLGTAIRATFSGYQASIEGEPSDEGYEQAARAVLDAAGVSGTLLRIPTGTQTARFVLAMPLAFVSHDETGTPDVIYILDADRATTASCGDVDIRVERDHLPVTREERIAVLTLLTARALRMGGIWRAAHCGERIACVPVDDLAGVTQVVELDRLTRLPWVDTITYTGRFGGAYRFDTRVGRMLVFRAPVTEAFAIVCRAYGIV